MSLKSSPQQRLDWIRKAHRIQLEIADLRLLIDVAMGNRPLGDTMKYLAMADVHCERAAEELDTAVNNIRSMP